MPIVSLKHLLIMLTKTFAAECSEIITISLRPYWVKTAMGGNNASWKLNKVHDMNKLISSLKIEDSGKFLDAQGNNHGKLIT